MTVSAYSTTPGLNTSINGIPIGPGMPRVYVDDAIQNLMADIKSWTVTFGVSNPVTIAQGGTGQTTVADAFNALAASGGTIGGAIKQNTYGAYPHFASSSIISPKIYIQAVGADPMANKGDIVFEY